MKRSRADYLAAGRDAHVSQEGRTQRQRTDLEYVHVEVFNRIYFPETTTESVSTSDMIASMEIEFVGGEFADNFRLCPCSLTQQTNSEDRISSYSSDKMDIDWCVCMNRQYQ